MYATNHYLSHLFASRIGKSSLLILVFPFFSCEIGEMIVDKYPGLLDNIAARAFEAIESECSTNCSLIKRPELVMTVVAFPFLCHILDQNAVSIIFL